MKQKRRGASPSAAPKLKRAPRLMLRESVYESVKQLLMDADLQPGMRLSIDGLARELQVSPTPVREALFRCEAEGLVVRRPNAGYTVAPLLDREGLLNLYNIRLLLEPEAAACAATNVNADDLREMDDAIRQMAPAIVGDNYKAYRDFSNQDARLHRTIASACGNPLIADTLERLRAHTHAYRLYFRHGIAEVTAAEHQAIMAAILARDTTAAEHAMRAHLEASRSRLLGAYDEPSADL
ncbi:GntR family transcriptional regulator [Actinopolymorpha sp. B17G11]|uniref:GntR family transcriptional regulator n=1 Tax=Actinopolymorpha sp. B17G11 TaxID=3160861 RepID=UPI0032E4D1F4